MPLQVHNKTTLVATLIIPESGTDSNVLDIDFAAAYPSLGIVAPAALTGTVSIQVPNGALGDSPTYVALQSPSGTDITIAASKAIVLTMNNHLPFPGFRLHSSGAEAAARTFYVFGAEA